MPETVTLTNWPNQPIPEVPDTLSSGMTDFESIHAEEAGLFDPVALAGYLREHAVDDEVLTIEVGGTRVRAAICKVGEDGKYTVRDLTGEECQLPPMTETVDGIGYLDHLKEYARIASERGLPVGMAFAGPLTGTKPDEHPKISTFIDDLNREFDGDLRKVFEGTEEFVVEHDGVAALARSVMELIENGAVNPTVALLINGGGLGLAVYQEGRLIRTEAGHFRADDELNVNGVDRVCGVYVIDGKPYICLENTIANGKGVVPQWEEYLGAHPELRPEDPDEQITGRHVENAAMSGDPYAMQLFEQVALAEAAILKRVAKIFGIEDVNDSRFKAVVHGGMHRTPNLRKRIAQILWGDQASEQAISFTEDLPEENACLSGIAAVLHEHRRRREAAQARTTRRGRVSVHGAVLVSPHLQ